MTSVAGRPTPEGPNWGPATFDTEPYSLTLFVSGASAYSARAIANVREICDAHLQGRHRLTIIDLNQEPALAGKHRILATPTLIKDQPLPTRMLVGDMSDHARFLSALDLPADGEAVKGVAD